MWFVGLDDDGMDSSRQAVVTLSHEGYAKAQPIDVYQAQRRGGKGKTATSTKDEDFIEKLFVRSGRLGILFWLPTMRFTEEGF